MQFIKRGMDRVGLGLDFLLRDIGLWVRTGLKIGGLTVLGQSFFSALRSDNTQGAVIAGFLIWLWWYLAYWYFPRQEAEALRKHQEDFEKLPAASKINLAKKPPIADPWGWHDKEPYNPEAIGDALIKTVVDYFQAVFLTIHILIAFPLIHYLLDYFFDYSTGVTLSLGKLLLISLLWLPIISYLRMTPVGQAQGDVD